jgi:uncharacterized protein (TIGR04255 family)
MADPLQPVTFDTPPVNEVALALQFAEPSVDLEVLGLLAGTLKEMFPVREQQPPLPPLSESPGHLALPNFELRFGVMSLPRTWFLSTDGHRLVQLQSDRLVLNWRRLAGDEPYPRYTALREELLHILGQLDHALSVAGKAPCRVNFCELTYINEINVPGTEAGERHPDLALIIDLVSRVRGRTFLPQAEDAQFQVRWRIPPDQLPDGAGVGRLYVAVSPGFRADTQLPVYGMNLTARIVPPPDTQLLAAVTLLDVGHDWIVRGFADLTTEDMQQQWGVRN